MADIYTAACDPNTDTVTAVMGSQMGKTEGIFNILGHRFDDGPYVPSLYIGPTEKQVRSVSADRVMKMLRSTPSLWAKLAKGQKNKVVEKWIAGVRMGFAWAGSATELASHPAGLVLVDERDRMTSDVGGEGDPVELARARLETYINGMMVVVSTPTIEGASPIVALWQEGTMGKWSWPCPHCGDFFVPTLALLQWPEGATANIARHAAWLACPNCGAQIEEHHKPSMNALGRYQYHRRDGDTLTPIDERVDHHHQSFWVSGLASPWRTWGTLASRLISAYASREAERIQAVINTGGGETWRTAGDAPDPEELEGRRQEYAHSTIPAGVQFITTGIDVQKEGLYYVVRGWGFNAESWKIESGYIAGETAFDNVWLLASRLVGKQYRDDIKDRHVSIARVFVDSGYRPGDRHSRPDHAVYSWCRRHAGLAYPTKGHDTQTQPLRMSKLDITVGGKTFVGGLKLWHLDTDHLKTWIHSRIRWPHDQPGGFWLDKDTTSDYCLQVTAEEVITKASGRRTWAKKRADNHFLDCEVNAYAAALTLQVHSLQPLTDAVNTDPNNPPTKSQPSENKGGFIPRTGGSFIRR